MGLAVCRFKEHCEVCPSVDCAPGLVDDSPSSGCLWHCCGCPTVPRGRVSVGTQVPCLQGPISPSGAPGGVLPRLLSFVVRAMAIAQLTHLHISIPVSGAPAGQVPEQCFPRGTFPIPVVRPPPGFLQFSWPREEWGLDGDPSLFNFSKELPGWFPWGYGGQSVDPPLLPVSPILPSSLDDSVVTNLGSSREESNTPSEAVIATQTVGHALPVGMGSDALADSPSPDVVKPFSGSPVGPVADLPKYLTGRVSRRSLGLVPRWRLAREGPFIAERLSSSLRSFGAGVLGSDVLG